LKLFERKQIMGPFESQVESLLKEQEKPAETPVEEGAKIVIQRTSETGYQVHGWNKAGKTFSAFASSPKDAHAVKRAVELGLR
jgi:hypothetical protein